MQNKKIETSTHNYEKRYEKQNKNGPRKVFKNESVSSHMITTP